MTIRTRKFFGTIFLLLLVVVRPGSALHALPRLAWDGRRSSLRALRVALAGVLMGKGAGT